jgi:hypothetical protein
MTPPVSKFDIGWCPGATAVTVAFTFPEDADAEDDLPYKVDLVDWHDIDDRWRQTIMADRVTLTEATPPDDAV